MPKFTVKKSTVIADSPQNIYTVVRDFKKWPSWSPWLITEPECEVNYAPDGNSYDWEGKIVGSGKMALATEEAPQSIDYKLMFIKPWKSESAVRFEFNPVDDGTEVSWIMNGSLPFFMFWMKRMMIAMIGMDYERGLKMLKAIIETGSNPSRLEFVGETSQPGCTYIGVNIESSIAEIGPKMSEGYEKLRSWLKESNTCPTGAPFSITHRFDMSNQFTQCTAAFPIESPPSSVPSDLVVGERPETNTYAVKHTGPYHFLGNAWASGMFRGRSRVFAQNKKIDAFEVYENNPQETPENDLITTVHFPVK